MSTTKAEQPRKATYRCYVVGAPDRRDPAFTVLVAKVREAARVAALDELGSN